MIMMISIREAEMRKYILFAAIGMALSLTACVPANGTGYGCPQTGDA